MELVREALANAKNYIQLISISDVVDVLIMTFVFYKVLTLIRKTQAAQVLKGILLLVVALAVATLGGLDVVNFILSNVLQIGLIALIILFQPELRKMLETFGASRFPRIFGRGEEPHGDLDGVIVQVVSACNTLSQQKIGVLLVFERAIILDDIIKTGTVVDAQISSMLIKNIFFPKAALHDGAAIVRDGRLCAAGCMLPLTSNNNLSPDLGMRHRAGVGMSEASDSVVVIVSEETGSISVAVGGMLKRHLNTETLAALLKNELMPSEQESAAQTGVKKVMSKIKIKGKKNDGKD